jgi:capsular polysaccharide biosynthesis protein
MDKKNLFIIFAIAALCIIIIMILNYFINKPEAQQKNIAVPQKIDIRHQDTSHKVEKFDRNGRRIDPRVDDDIQANNGAIAF